jgi:hypothetical protein
MAETVGDLMIQRLYAWGVRTIYGYPGDGINGLMGPMEPAGDPKKLLSSLIHGDPDRWRVIKQSAKQLWAGMP